jgi:hypothetical protein
MHTNPPVEPEETVRALKCGATVIGRFAIARFKTLPTENDVFDLVKINDKTLRKFTKMSPN